MKTIVMTGIMMIQASRAEIDEKAHQLEENQKILQSLARYFPDDFFKEVTA